MAEITCKTHPDAPHGFDRNASHNADRYVCECENWEPKPVAWANSFDLQNFDMKVRTCPDLHHTVPLYTAPPKQWVGLTDEEVSYCRYAATFCDELDTAYMAELIEQALKEKNNG
jgi:hypothetical protein